VITPFTSPVLPLCPLALARLSAIESESLWPLCNVNYQGSIGRVHKNAAAASSQSVSQAPSFAPADEKMSLSASTRDASKGQETGDAVDLTLADHPNLRPILFPKSESSIKEAAKRTVRWTL
jgi:hypothetical protein